MAFERSSRSVGNKMFRSGAVRLSADLKIWVMVSLIYWFAESCFRAYERSYMKPITAL